MAKAIEEEGVWIEFGGTARELSSCSITVSHDYGGRVYLNIDPLARERDRPVQLKMPASVAMQLARDLLAAALPEA